jgi:hypothetical protein
MVCGPCVVRAVCNFVALHLVGQVVFSTELCRSRSTSPGGESRGGRTRSGVAFAAQGRDSPGATCSTGMRGLREIDFATIAFLEINGN